MERTPRSSSAWTSLIQALLNLDKPSAALDTALLAVQQVPRDAWLWLSLATLQYGFGRYGAALQSAQTGIVVEAWAHQTMARDKLHLLRAACLMSLRQFEKARYELALAHPETELIIGSPLTVAELRTRLR